MSKTIALILASGALIPMFWMDVVPNGQQICMSDVAFATPYGTQAQVISAKYAKEKFCKIVHDFPM